MNWRSIVSTSLAVSVLGLVGCGRIEDEQVNQQTAVDAEAKAVIGTVSEQAATEWFFRNASASVEALRPGVQLGFFDTYDNSYLKYQSRNFGINLSWQKNFLENVTVERSNGRDHRTIRSHEKVALKIKGGGYVKYERRDWGINLAWSSTPSFEWELRGAGYGNELRLNERVRLYNLVAKDNVVYCWRQTPTVNLAWSKDCYVVGGRRVYKP